MNLNYFLIMPLLLLCINCERQPKSSALGPQTSLNEILKIQGNSLAKLDPYSVESGQSVYKVETQEVITSQGPIKSLSKEWIVQVVQVEEEKGYRFLTTVKSVTDKYFDENFVYKFKDIYAIQGIEPAKLQDQLNLNSYSPSKLTDDLRTLTGLGQDEIQGVAFHNLVSSDVKMSPPPLVKKRPDCGGKNLCSLDATLITYDIVFLLSDGSTRTNNIEWYISADVPFFAGILKQCATAFVPVDKIRVLVKQCIDVVDYQH